uniref:Peptidase M13 C-terminal domain-containing protein n=1 Tax=Tetranychus urticae TaxID=32264 RepID=T1KHZ8_TETUR
MEPGVQVYPRVFQLLGNSCNVLQLNRRSPVEPRTRPSFAERLSRGLLQVSNYRTQGSSLSHRALLEVPTLTKGGTDYKPTLTHDCKSFSSNFAISFLQKCIYKSFLIQCMIDQYDGYSVDELNMTLSGDLSKGENMADNGGLKLALKAYESWAKGRPQEPPLPGLEFTPDKLFWIGAANVS